MTLYSFFGLSRALVLASVAAISFGAASLMAGQSDLVVKEFQGNGTPSWKNGNLEIPVRFRVENQGNGNASINFVNLIRVSGKDRWTGFMNPLSPGESMMVNAVVKVADPNKLLSGRSLQLIVHADAPVAAADTSIPPYGRIDESNDDNNTKTLNVTVPGGLELKGEKPAAPTGQGRPSGLKAPEASRVPRILGKTRG